ncbi:MAG: hypothetical protein ICV73_11760 [Acetobacteraceae bacterium]|nr:hypothetical protein [Acetobacteraceae bacterium]
MDLPLYAALGGAAPPPLQGAAPAPSWEASPPLPLDEPPRPVATPIEVGVRLWGPFERLYMEGKAGGHAYTIATGAFEARPLPDGEVRISTRLHVPGPEGVGVVELAMVRAASGELRDTEMTERPGMPLDPASREALAPGLSRSFGGFLRRQSLATGDTFSLGGEAGAAGALACRVVGLSGYRGRPVLFVRCASAQPVGVDGGWSGMIASDGHAAVDVETGVVLLSHVDGRILFAASPQQAGDGETAGPLFSVRSWFALEENPAA